jgi:glycosyltransferase involved in cell wall biosynthesis
VPGERGEGFGLVALEAMVAGTPVVGWRAGALPEVVGEAGVLVDPYDVASIATGIEEADRRRDELVALGVERARLYTWQRSAAAAVAAYRRAVE